MRKRDIYELAKHRAESEPLCIEDILVDMVYQKQLQLDAIMEALEKYSITPKLPLDNR